MVQNCLTRFPRDKLLARKTLILYFTIFERILSTSRIGYLEIRAIFDRSPDQNLLRNIISISCLDFAKKFKPVGTPRIDIEHVKGVLREGFDLASNTAISYGPGATIDYKETLKKKLIMIDSYIMKVSKFCYERDNNMITEHEETFDNWGVIMENFFLEELIKTVSPSSSIRARPLACAHSYAQKLLEMNSYDKEAWAVLDFCIEQKQKTSPTS